MVEADDIILIPTTPEIGWDDTTAAVDLKLSFQSLAYDARVRV